MDIIWTSVATMAPNRGAVPLAFLVLALISTVYAGPNFTDCRARFLSRPENDTTYDYNGTLPGLSAQKMKDIISVEGCKDFCGPGVDYYKWKDIADTITTWILPVIGLLLQAPYECNEFKNSVYALIRWVGSPVASLATILWNIKMVGKAALLFDMSGPCDFHPKPGDETVDLGLRDSLYILTVMNQYRVNPAVPPKFAPKLLRVALFTHLPSPTKGDLRDPLAENSTEGNQSNRTAKNSTEGDESNPPARDPAERENQKKQAGKRKKQQEEKKKEMVYSKKKEDLLRERKLIGVAIREGRKRGVVPVIITLGWFIFSLAISIHQAFGDLGGNETAHDLALGLLLAWIPVLILSCIVDRNPVLTNSTRNKLNQLVHKATLALADPDFYERLTKEVGGDENTFDWAKNSGNWKWTKIDETNHQDPYTREAETKNAAPEIENPQSSPAKFFTAFAGQGRKRWHYGVAHPILAGIERQILQNPAHPDLSERERNRNWLANHDIKNELIKGTPSDLGLHEFDTRELWEILGTIFIFVGTVFGAFLISYRTPTVGLGCRSGGYLIFGVIALGLFGLEMMIWAATGMKGEGRPEEQDKTLPKEEQTYTGGKQMPTGGKQKSTKSKPKKPWVNRILQFLELVSTGWLTYIVMSQTIGAYQTCDCQSSSWGQRGGYIDFRTSEKAPGVQKYWLAGSLISCIIMFFAIIFLITEWCEQSHLNSEDIGKALQGLGYTRLFKQRTIWLRTIAYYGIKGVKLCWHISTVWKHPKSGSDVRKSIVWTQGPSVKKTITPV